MQVVLAVIKLFFWLAIAPFVIGLLFNFILPRDRRKPGLTFILGFLIYLAGFEAVAIPCMINITYNAFSYCVRYFLILVWILIILGAGRICYALLIKKDIGLIINLTREAAYSGEKPDREKSFYWIVFGALLLFQMVMSVVMASFDGDDAYYVVESLLAQQADVMNTILPYTGISTSLDIRHALAVITMWIAFVAKVCGVHATIVSHSVIPLLFIPLVYLVYAEIAGVILKKKREYIPVFMVIVSLLMIFGNVSIHTPATFFLMRTWQGKAMVANLVFPLIFWVFLDMLDHVKAIGPYSWIMLGLINMLSGMCSAMGVIFSSGIIAFLTLLVLFLSKKWTVLLGAFLCVIPNFIYLALYLSIWSR